MRKTNITKSEITVDTSTQTPIEIALQIDENGMTTASQLYSFLELDPSNFSRWCSRNITKNKFATENIDYEVFVIKEENLSGGRPKTDYRLTSDFAKKLSMTGNTERHEQARDYFIACEQGLKIATEKLKSDQKSDNKLLEDTLYTLTTVITQMQQDISTLKETNNKKKLPEKKYSRWKTNTFKKLNALTEYANEHSDEHITLTNTIHIIIKDMEDTYDFDLVDYVKAYKSEFELDSEPYVLDVINNYKDVKDMYTLTLNHVMDKLNLKTENVVSEKNIFDELAEKLENDLDNTPTLLS